MAPVVAFDLDENKAQQLVKCRTQFLVPGKHRVTSGSRTCAIDGMFPAPNAAARRGRSSRQIARTKKMRFDVRSAMMKSYCWLVKRGNDDG